MMKRHRSPAPNSTAPADGAGWSKRARYLASGLIAAHLLAVFTPPFAFASRGGPGNESPLARLLMRTVRPYVDLLYLNHGYFFFAPNPGASYLVRYRATFADGRPDITGRFPNSREQWPRLLYHRYFMLSEQWNAIYLPKVPPPEVARDPQRLEGWKAQRDVFEAQRDSMIAHLKHAHGADEVSIVRVEHPPGDWFDILQSGRRLNDRESYREIADEIAEEIRP